MENEKEQKKVVSFEEKITRKEALIKASKYAAFTALGTMLILSPKKSQAGSGLPADPGSFGKI